MSSDAMQVKRSWSEQRQHADPLPYQGHKTAKSQLEAGLGARSLIFWAARGVRDESDPRLSSGWAESCATFLRETNSGGDTMETETNETE